MCGVQFSSASLSLSLPSCHVLCVFLSLTSCLSFFLSPFSSFSHSFSFFLSLVLVLSLSCSFCHSHTLCQSHFFVLPSSASSPSRVLMRARGALPIEISHSLSCSPFLPLTPSCFVLGSPSCSLARVYSVSLFCCPRAVGCRQEVRRPRETPQTTAYKARGLLLASTCRCREGHTEQDGRRRTTQKGSSRRRIC